MRGLFHAEKWGLFARNLHLISKINCMKKIKAILAAAG